MRRIYPLVVTAIIAGGCGFGGEVVDDSGLDNTPISASTSASPRASSPVPPASSATGGSVPSASSLPSRTCTPVAEAASTLRVTRQVEAGYNVTLMPPQSGGFCGDVEVRAAWFTVTFPNDENYTLYDVGSVQSARLPGVGDQPESMTGPDEVLCADSMVIAYVGDAELAHTEFPELKSDGDVFIGASTSVDETTLYGRVVAATYLPYRFSAELDC